MFPVIEYIKTCLNGLRSRIEKVEKSISQALASVKADIIQDIKNVRKESAEAIKSSTADWGQNDSNALDYVKNRTHYMLPATPIGSLEFTATSSGTIEYTMTSSEEEFAIFQYFQSLRDKGEVLKVTVGGKTGLLAVTFDRGNFGFSGVLDGSVRWNAGNVLSLVAQNDFIIFNQGDVYTVSFEDTTKPYYIKLDFNYMPDNVYHSENAPVKFGTGNNSTVQGNSTTSSGVNAHAEGLRSKASGVEAHAEGSYSEASGSYSHAEGSNTVASGEAAHAEGDNTVSSGEAAHAEGNYTVANRKCMHAAGAYNLYDDTKYFDVVSSSKHRFVGRYYAAAEYVFDANTGYYTLVNAELKNVTIVGLYYANPAQYENGTIDHLMKPVSQISGALHNVEDHDSTLGTSLRGKYVHVVGNGDSSTRSNAYTLDWDGNGWFAGDVFVGGASQDEGVKLLKAGEAIPIPQTASAGQTIVVKSVDENGKPTEWEPVTLPDKLPNPNALTFTGAATGSYDGSKPLTVNVPPVSVDDSLTKQGQAADAKAVGDAISSLSGKKINLPKDENGESQNGTDGQILQTNGDGTTQWVDKPAGGGGDIALGITGATVGQIAKITAVDDTGKPTAWEPVDMDGGWELITYVTLTEDGGGAFSGVITRNDNGEEFEYRQCMVCISGTVIDGWPSGAAQYITLHSNNDASGNKASIVLTRLSPGAGGSTYKSTIELSLFAGLLRCIACGGQADTSSLILRVEANIDTFKSITFSCYGNSQWTTVPYAAGGRIVIYGRK